jgi:hypothetical protein
MLHSSTAGKPVQEAGYNIKTQLIKTCLPCSSTGKKTVGNFEIHPWIERAGSRSGKYPQWDGLVVNCPAGFS